MDNSMKVPSSGPGRGQRDDLPLRQVSGMEPDHVSCACHGEFPRGFFGFFGLFHGILEGDVWKGQSPQWFFEVSLFSLDPYCLLCFPRFQVWNLYHETWGWCFSGRRRQEGGRAAKKFNDTLRSHVLACFGELMSSPEFCKPLCLIGVPFEY